MNKRLSEALTRVHELPEDRQEAAADLLIDFIENPEAYELTKEQLAEILTPEQIAEIERRLDDDDFATPEEVEAFFARFKA